jgi:hypothetical protein
LDLGQQANDRVPPITRRRRDQGAEMRNERLRLVHEPPFLFLIPLLATLLAIGHVTATPVALSLVRPIR